MTLASRTHVVLIPSYNPGRKVFETVRAAREQWEPVWVVVDGSTDGTGAGLQEMALGDPGLRVIVRGKNGGKGSAVLDGLTEASAQGFTHVLTMDSDGQHPPDRIAAFMADSGAHPEAMILGEPVFDASAPSIRVKGRRISNWWANLETLWAGRRARILPAQVRYFTPAEGGVSHFHYGRDNALLSSMHARLFAGFVVR